MKRELKAGEKYHSLTLVRTVRIKGKFSGWECRCDCGSTVNIYSSLVGVQKTCGPCWRDSRFPIGKVKGARIGKYTILEKMGGGSGKRIRYLCRCECGGNVEIENRQLDDQSIRPAGCVCEMPCETCGKLFYSGQKARFCSEECRPHVSKRRKEREAIH